MPEKLSPIQPVSEQNKLQKHPAYWPTYQASLVDALARRLAGETMEQVADKARLMTKYILDAWPHDPIYAAWAESIDVRNAKIAAALVPK